MLGGNSRYITIYSLDFSQCFVIESPGVFSYDDVSLYNGGFDSFVSVNSSGVDVAINGDCVLWWSSASNIFYSFPITKNDPDLREKSFWKQWAEIEYKVKFQEMIDE